jgi:hypothetical protein
MARDASGSDDGDGGRRVLRLVGIYHASGTLWGELSYWLKARTGAAHCSLCDITHGSVREKSEWKLHRAALPVPFDAVHLDERGDAVRAFTEGRTPCVVAECSDGLVLLVDSAQLAACAGSPERLVASISDNAAALGLDLD